MIDLKQLYIELISDLSPFEDLSEHETLELHEMLYNLIEIRNNDLESIDDTILVERFDELIKLFKAVGVSPYY